MKRFHLLIGLIVFLFVVVIIEAAILLYRKLIPVSNTKPTTSQSLQNPVKIPEQQGRQAVYIAETGGLQSASATLAYSGEVAEITINDSSQIVKLVIDAPDIEDMVTFYFDSNMIQKTYLVEDEKSVSYKSAAAFQDSFYTGDTLQVVFDYNILTNEVSRITIEKILK